MKSNCDVCFHQNACLSAIYYCGEDATEVMSNFVNCEDFIDKRCVRLEMTKMQIDEATEYLNKKGAELLALRKKLEGGERSLDLYKMIMEL